jgi:hypothetical protein
MAFNRTPNQQDLSWFIDMKTQGRLELDPPYQRRSVWTSKDKQFFLDTILNNYPCPAVYLQKENTEKGPLYNVVDGKQRLSTVLDFYNGKIRLSKTFGIADYRGKKFSDLPDDVKSEFYNYIFMVEQIRSDEDVEWGEVFQRVNKNQKKLAEQELRHARFDGWLIRRAESEVENKIWESLGISSKARRMRMKDAEFVSILMLVILEQRFIGFPQHKIDELYAKYDFVLDEIPEDEADLNDLDEVEFDGITKELIQEFETKFNKILSFISKMEEHNQCVTKHKKRLFTDFYSLWSALVFDEEIMEKGVEKIAELYEGLISLVDGAYVKTKAGDSLDDLPYSVQSYFGNSTGAATEEEPRRLRNMALMEYVNNN